MDQLVELSLTKAEVDAIRVGGSCAVIAQQSLLLHKAPDGALRAAPNACVHMGGSFDMEDMGSSTVAKCVLHGWRIDTATMEYVPGSVAKMIGGASVPVTAATKQPVYTVTRRADGGATLTPPRDGKCVAC